LQHPAWITAYVVVAHVQGHHLDVDLRHAGQQIGDAGVLFLRVDANVDWRWRIVWHQLSDSPSSYARGTCLSQAMIAGEPLLALRNFHDILTNISRHRPEYQTRVLDLKTSEDLLASLHLLLNLLRARAHVIVSVS